MYKTILFILALLPVFSKSDTRELSLKDCIELGLNRSPQAKILLHEYNADQWNYQSFRAGLAPHVKLNGTIPDLDRSIVLVAQPEGGSEFHAQSQSYSRLNLTLSKNIVATGGNLFASSNLSRVDQFGQEHYYYWRASPLTLGYTQPLFRSNSLKWSDDIERLKMKLSHKKYVENREKLAVQIISGFFDLYISQQLLKNTEFNVTINDTIYTISKGRFSVGKIAENELLQSELAVMNSENNYRRAKLNYERAREKFQTLIGLSEDINFEIQLPDKLENLNIDSDTAVEYAKQNGSSLINWQVQKLESDQSVQDAKKNQWLSADLTATMGYNQTAQSVEDLYRKPLDTESFSIGFEIPITRSQNNAQLMAAEQRRARTAIAKEQFETEFVQGINYQVKEFKLLEEQLMIATKSDAIAIRQFQTAKDRYLIDKTDVTTLFLAQNELDSTHRQYYQTLKDYWIAYYQLRAITLYDFENNKMLD